VPVKPDPVITAINRYRAASAELDKIAVREPTLPNGNPADETEEYVPLLADSGPLRRITEGGPDAGRESAHARHPGPCNSLSPTRHTRPRARSSRNGGRDHFGTVGVIISEWWATSFRNPHQSRRRIRRRAAEQEACAQAPIENARSSVCALP
jgi:hypothetical protein